MALRLCVASGQLLQNRTAEGILVFRRDQRPRLAADKLRQAAFVGSHHRQPTGHGLQSHKAERLAAGGHHKDVRCIVKPPQLVLLLVSKKEGVLQSQQLVQLRQPVALLAIAGDERDDLPFCQPLIPARRTQQRVHALEGRQLPCKQDDVFPAVEKPKGIEQSLLVHLFPIEDVFVVAVGQQKQLVRSRRKHRKRKVAVVRRDGDHPFAARDSLLRKAMIGRPFRTAHEIRAVYGDDHRHTAERGEPGKAPCVLGVDDIRPELPQRLSQDRGERREILRQLCNAEIRKSCPALRMCGKTGKVKGERVSLRLGS